VSLQREDNYAFIDTQNLISAIERLGWSVDFEKLFKHLSYKYRATKIFAFIGYVEKFARSYKFLESIGYHVCFKPVVADEFGRLKANIDADLVLKVLLEKENYTKAIIVSGDGDFYSLVEYLKKEDKLKIVLCPDSERCSYLLRASAQGDLEGLNEKRNQIGRG
jgi:uncharacterized LabA/DUF88 family protein